jgi:hypothetical protein
MSLAIGALWVMVGLLGMLLLNKAVGPQMLFVSNSTDAAYFGDSPERLLASDPALLKLRTLLIRVITGFMVLAGLLYVFVAWFALRQGQSWAPASLFVSGFLAICLWAVALAPYVRSGIRLTLGDLPPFMWVPALLLIPAFILGSVGVR